VAWVASTQNGGVSEKVFKARSWLSLRTLQHSHAVTHNEKLIRKPARDYVCVDVCEIGTFIEWGKGRPR
jgi:hypothetical protein